MSRRFFALASLVAAGCTMQHQQSSQSMVMDDHSAHMSAADMNLAPVPRSAATSTYQGDPALPPSANTAAARLRASPRHGEWVTIAVEPGSKDSVEAWIVYPVSRSKAPVVVVVHEIFGLSTWVRGVADQVAAEGFIAIAPDFNTRTRGGPSTVELSSDSARKLYATVNPAEQSRYVDAAANYAMMQPSALQRYAIIGYCWGGGATFYHVINEGVKGLSGGVAYYGLPYMGGGQRATATTPAVPATFILDSLKKINVPVMLLSGTGDARIAAAMPALDSLMKALHKSYVGIDYEGAIHGFLRAQDDSAAGPQRDPAAFAAQQKANLAATKDAWPRTVAFLKKNLGVK